jgi:hypothetical protein
MKLISEDSALFAWIGILVVTFLYVLAYDLWAGHTGHLTMTAQFRRWLVAPIVGPVVFGLYIALPAGLTWHFFMKGR